MFQIIFIISIVFLILEMFTPAMFFLNLAIAAFLTSFVALITSNINVLLFVFAIFAMISLYWLRPLMMKSRNNKEDIKTGIEDKYINKIVEVIKPIDKYSGAITIYDERWEARNLNDGTIPVGSKVRIVRNESLIMFVEQV